MCETFQLDVKLLLLYCDNSVYGRCRRHRPSWLEPGGSDLTHVGTFLD